MTLKVDGSLKSQTAGGALPYHSYIYGTVELRIEASVPPAIGMVPGVDQAVQLVLDEILKRIEGSLKVNLPREYLYWAREQARSAARQQQAVAHSGVHAGEPTRSQLEDSGTHASPPTST